MAQGYVKGRSLGEGTWGRVYEATRKKDNVVVAIKRIKQITEGRNDGVSFSALREVKYLREIRHRNIIEVSQEITILSSIFPHHLRQLHDVYFSDNALHLVFEWCITDLEVVSQLSLILQLCLILLDHS
jgi:cyclin-dependent kinase 7